MNEPSQGHLVTVPIEALHTQLAHTSFICSHLKKKTKNKTETCWLAPLSLERPSRVSFLLLLCPLQLMNQTQRGGFVPSLPEKKHSGNLNWLCCKKQKKKSIYDAVWPADVKRKWFTRFHIFITDERFLKFKRLNDVCFPGEVLHHKLDKNFQCFS